MKSDHFYTVSQLERDIEFAYSDYIEEGIACFVPECPVPGTMPLRFYHASKHDHLYTTSADEGAIAVAKRGYTSQGISCHVFASQIEGTQPLLRLFNSKTYDHLYTTSSIEADNAVKMYNYQSEGTACFVFTDPEPATIPLFRLVQSSQVKQHTVESQWAVLLCKFSNEKSEPPAAMGVPAWRDACTRFTTKSDSSFNLVRYYADVSHGKVDLTGSQVLGWYDIAAKLLPPNANGDRVPDKSQDEVIDLAKKAAKKAGVKIDKFVGVIVIMNEATGWAQGSPGAVAMDWRRVDGRNFDGTLVPRGPGGGNGLDKKPGSAMEALELSLSRGY